MNALPAASNRALLQVDGAESEALQGGGRQRVMSISTMWSQPDAVKTMRENVRVACFFVTTCLQRAQSMHEGELYGYFGATILSVITSNVL